VVAMRVEMISAQLSDKINKAIDYYFEKKASSSFSSPYKYSTIPKVSLLTDTYHYSLAEMEEFYGNRIKLYTYDIADLATELSLVC